MLDSTPPAESPSEPLAEEMRLAARKLFAGALAQASIERAFEQQVSCERGVLRVCGDLYNLDSYTRVFVVSLGKAGHTLVNALEAQAGSRFEGIVATSVESAAQVRGFRYFFGGHPVPNQESWRAAEAMLKSLRGLDSSSLVIFMISGGGSSIVEKPLYDGISIEDLIATYRALVLSGAPIAEINAVRKHLSSIKGGRLAQAAAGAQQLSLLVSDVPDKTPDALASGPTMPDSTSVEDCYVIAEKYSLPGQLPGSVKEIFERRALEETPKADDAVFLRSRWWTLLSNRTVLDAAHGLAAQAGFTVEIDNDCDDWDYAPAADHLLGRLRELRLKSKRVCLISGGEVTVKVSSGGVGGRNQQFVLACAGEIAGENIAVLSAGTDGIDGNSPAAGAVVDGTTLNRATVRGLDPRVHLKGFDAYPFFEKLGDALVTGATGNNLRDLRILLAY